MTQLNDTPHFLLSTLITSLAALTAGCPARAEYAEALADIRELAARFPAAPDQEKPPERALAIPQALSLAELTLDSAITLTDLTDVDGPAEETIVALTVSLELLLDRLALSLRREQADRVRGLYVIIDPEVTGGREPLEIARAAVNGGAKMLQLRDKLRDKGEILPLAQDLQALCAANDVLLIINDHVDLAAIVGSGGVHVGQTDMPVAEARQVLAADQVLGRSNREIDLLIESQEMGADHVAFGAIYQTTTKTGGRGPQGPERLKEARAVTQVPLVAIGGITADNVGPVIEYGADAVCVTAAVGLAPEPEAAASRLVAAIRQAGGEV